jgi:hypothetical protein
MNNIELRAKILQEVEHIPEDQLIKLYEHIHLLRLSSGSISPLSIMEFAGCWRELPEEIYSELYASISQRRHQAFSQREDRETFLN